MIKGLNQFRVVINCDPCNTGTDEKLNITFIIHSGTALTEINTRTSTEIELEKTLLGKYQLYKTLQANVKSGFQYNHYYNLTICARFNDSQEQTCKTKILGIYKPAISAAITNLPTLLGVADSIEFNGARSSIPFETDEKVNFNWQCVSCYSYILSSDCDCLNLTKSQASRRVFGLEGNTLEHACKYIFRLSITSQSGEFLRTASVEGMFITVSGSFSNVEGITFYGKQNDIYFTFAVNYKGKDSDLSFQWSLLEISCSSSSNYFSYSMLNTFIYDFFLKKSITLNELCKSEDQEIPASLKPTEITTNTSRILGLDKFSLISECHYKYAVLIQEPTVLSAAIVSIQAPKLPTSRVLYVSPTLGYALETIFTFTFPVSSGASDPDEIVKILAVKCNGSEQLVYSIVGPSTSFEGFLSSGEPDCEYEVIVILRVTLGEDYVDSNFTITVQPSKAGAITAISNILSQAQFSDSYLKILSMLLAISQTTITEESAQAKSNIETVYDVLSELDDENTGVLLELDETSKLQFLNSSLLILKYLMENNIPENLNLTVQNLIENKIYKYILSWIY